MPSSPIQILALDDEADLCALTKEFLEMSKDMKVDTASSVKEAMGRLTTKHYDVIVSDYQMPCEDGIKFLKSIRAAGDKTPFILFTGKGREEVVIEALNNGADSYLQKGGMPAPLYAELEHRIHTAVQKHRVEEALRSLAVRNDAILTAVPDIIMEVDERKIYTWANQAGLRFFGGDVVGQEASHYFVGEQQTYTKVQPLFDGSEDFINLESWQRRQDGEERLLSWSCKVLKDEKGCVTGVLSSAHDITERKRAEGAMIEREDYLRKILQTTADGFWMLDVDGKVTDVNETYCRMSGYTRDELLKLSIPDLEAVEDSAETAAHIDRLIKSGSEIFETRHRRKDGSIFDVEVSVTYKSTGFNRIICFSRDITERKIAEDRVRSSEENYRQLFEMEFDALFLIDNRSGQLLKANNAAEQMYTVGRNCFR
jgi:PAS domain S-box-containing protein